MRMKRFYALEIEKCIPFLKVIKYVRENEVDKVKKVLGMFMFLHSKLGMKSLILKFGEIAE